MEAASRPSPRPFVGPLGRLQARWQRLTLARRFNLASLLILLFAMLVLGWWVGAAIEVGVIHRTAAATSLYVENFIVTQLQELEGKAQLSAEAVSDLERLLTHSPLGREVVAIKVWSHDGRIVYGDEVGRTFPVKDELERAWQGQVAAHISHLNDPENVSLSDRYTRLLETYTPIRIEGSDRVIAVAEFYQTVDALEREIRLAQWRSWLVVGGVMLLTYALLVGLVRQGSHTITRQQHQLAARVVAQNTLLAQNEALHRRIRRAATRTTALNERVLRRISAELHDGPAQDLSFALLRLDNVATQLTTASASPADGVAADLEAIQRSLTQAAGEIRSIAGGLRLPELERLSLPETLARVVREHQRRSGIGVEVSAEGLPDEASLPIKIALYRVVLEALSNAVRHAGGQDQSVRVEGDGDALHIVVGDRGPGFDLDDPGRLEGDVHLGLVGMRERVESLGGVFSIESDQRGTRVRARLPLQVEEPHA